MGQTDDLNTITQSILDHNANRDPDRLKLKFKALRADPFSFYRGTCHLFYSTLPQEPIILDAPAIHICGDLHLENFGTYKGDNRLTYFDINDFDEAALAPFTLDLLRFLASIHLAGRIFRWRQGCAREVCTTFLETYRVAMLEGKARWIERATATGMVGALLDNVKKRSRIELLDQKTRKVAGHRTFRVDGKHMLAAGNKQTKRARAILSATSAAQQTPDFFKVLDVARRIAGNGSLGLERYAVLIEGRGSPDWNYLLDIKYSAPSCLLPFISTAQPHWRCEADRVVGTQQLVQAVPPALLQSLPFDEGSYLLKELQPSADRLDLGLCNGRIKRLNDVVRSMASVTAWAHLRGSGRWGAAHIEDVQGYLSVLLGSDALLSLAKNSAKRVVQQWRDYSAAYDKGDMASG